MLTSFYKTGVPNVSLNSYVPMDFRVDWGFPRIAKIAVGVMALLTLGMVALMFHLGVRHRRSKARRFVGAPRH